MDGTHTAAIPVADGTVRHLDTAVILHRRIRRHDTFTHPGAAHDRFKDAARFVNDTDATVKPVFRSEPAVVVGIKGRPAAHGQDGARFRVHDDHGGAGGISPLHGVVQGIFYHKLHLAVDGQVHRRNLGRTFIHQTAFRYGAPQGVHFFFLIEQGAFQNSVQGQFQTGQAAVILAYETQNLGGHRLLGIIPFAFLLKI